MGSTAHLGTWANGGQYSFRQFPHLKPQGPHMPITESYVVIPPALWVRDEENALWTLGFDYNHNEWLSGRWEYDVIRNGRKTGEFARNIEFRGKKIIIYGSEGRKVWNGRCFV